MKSPAALTDAFRASGLKVTPQRQLIFRLMHDNITHPTADALFTAASAQMPGISLRTVYQTLTDLASMGEIKLIDLGSGATHFDPNTDEHHHVVCSACGEVRDVYVDDAARLSISGVDGFVVDSAAILFHGLCAVCRDSNPTINPNTKKESKP